MLINPSGISTCCASGMQFYKTLGQQNRTSDQIWFSRENPNVVWIGQSRVNYVLLNHHFVRITLKEVDMGSYGWTLTPRC